MPENYSPIWVKKDTKKMLLEECKKIYLKAHPEMQHVLISADKIMYEVCLYYID